MAFPSSPSNQATHTIGNKTWTYSTTNDQWTRNAGAGAGSTAKYVSAYTAMADGGQIVFAHGLGAEPDIITYRFKCIIEIGDYSVNDIIDMVPQAHTAGANKGTGSVVNATNIILRISSNGPGAYSFKNSGGLFIMHSLYWKVQVKAFVIS